MCDVEKYNQIFRDIKNLHHQNIVQLMLETESEEVREFYTMVRNYFLQKEQRKVIERNLF